MATFNVFLDTNIYIQTRYDFDKGSLLHLKKYCDDGVVATFTNDIITCEVKHHINTDIKLFAAQAKNSIKDHSELLNAISPEEYEEIKEILLSSPGRLISAFDSHMNGATILSNDGLSVADLFCDYFDSNPPFEGSKDKKSEFPDAVVIMSIKRFMESSEISSLHVVTNDNGWHNALSSISNITLHKNIKSLLTKISKDKDVLYKRIVTFINEEIAQLQQNAESWLLDQEWEFVVNGIDPYIECDEVDEINTIQVNLIPDGIEYIDVEEEYAVATLSGEATVTIGFTYIDHTNEIYDKEDHLWYNTEYGDGIVEIEVPISMSTNILFSSVLEDKPTLDAPDFSEIDKDAIVLVQSEFAERSNEIHHPYYDICPDCGEKIGIHNDGGNGFCTNCASNH